MPEITPRDRAASSGRDVLTVEVSALLDVWGADRRVAHMLRDQVRAAWPEVGQRLDDPLETRDATADGDPAHRYEDWPENLPRADLIRFVRGYGRELREVEQILAGALGWPLGDGEVWPADEYVTGDHTPVTIAMEAARKINASAASGDTATTSPADLPADPNDLYRWRCRCGQQNPGIRVSCTQCGTGYAAGAVVPDPAPATTEDRPPAHIGGEASGVLWMALRYALGRSTYAVQEVVAALREHAHLLPAWWRGQMAAEIEQARVLTTGMDCDQRAWRQAVEILADPPGGAPGGA